MPPFFMDAAFFATAARTSYSLILHPDSPGTRFFTSSLKQPGPYVIKDGIPTQPQRRIGFRKNRPSAATGCIVWVATFGDTPAHRAFVDSNMNGLARWWMRCDLLFTVSTKVTNRYLLCRMLSVSARKMHREGSLAGESINRSLQTLLDSQMPGKKATLASAAGGLGVEQKVVTVLDP